MPVSPDAQTTMATDADTTAHLITTSTAGADTITSAPADPESAAASRTGLAPVDRTVPPRKLTVVGTGYVGLTTGACLSTMGFDVTCADVDPAKIEILQSGGLPIHERGLQDIVDRGRSNGTLRFQLGAEEAVRTADVVLMCVPTPQGADGSADLTYLLDAAASIADHLRPGAVVLNKSTVPVGSAAVVATRIGRDDIDVASNPEFLREGTAVDDFLNPDRVIIGSDDPATGEWLRSMYDETHTDVFVTGTAAAETIKYVANGFLAMKVSFANAVAALCEAVGADVFDVMRGIGSDRRIGFEFLQPGPGWGGSCFPKDSRALVSIGDAHGYDFEMMRSAIAVNDQQRTRIVDKVLRAAGRSIDDPRRLADVRVGVLGLTFKAHTDDLRESPSLGVIGQLRELGASVIAYDPTTSHGLDSVQRTQLADIEIAGEPVDVADDADVVVLLTEWPEFRTVIDDEFVAAMRGNAIVDGRNLLEPAQITAHGLLYEGVGR